MLDSHASEWPLRGRRDLSRRIGRRGVHWSLGFSIAVLSTIGAGGCDKPGGEAPTPAASASNVPAPMPSGAVSASAAASTSVEPAQVKPVDAIIAQHVLVIYKGAKRAPKGITRSKSDAKARAEEALGKIRAGSAFEDIVKQYSDDAGSVDRMGSLGKFHRDDMDPAFSAAAFALQPGQVSDVVETPFGFHVIKRTQ